jgi:hypothetical protein
MLVEDDQLVHQPGILALEPGGNGKVFIPRLFLSNGGGIVSENWANSFGDTHLIPLDDRLAIKFHQK